MGKGIWVSQLAGENVDFEVFLDAWDGGGEGDRNHWVRLNNDLPACWRQACRCRRVTRRAGTAGLPSGLHGECKGGRSLKWMWCGCKAVQL